MSFRVELFRIDARSLGKAIQPQHPTHGDAHEPERMSTKQFEIVGQVLRDLTRLGVSKMQPGLVQEGAQGRIAQFLEASRP